VISIIIKKNREEKRKIPNTLRGGERYIQKKEGDFKCM
jgi:hypothetical protein